MNLFISILSDILKKWICEIERHIEEPKCYVFKIITLIKQLCLAEHIYCNKMGRQHNYVSNSSICKINLSTTLHSELFNSKVSVFTIVQATDIHDILVPKNCDELMKISSSKGKHISISNVRNIIGAFCIHYRDQRSFMQFTKFPQYLPLMHMSRDILRHEFDILNKMNEVIWCIYMWF